MTAKEMGVEIDKLEPNATPWEHVVGNGVAIRVYYRTARSRAWWSVVAVYGATPGARGIILSRKQTASTVEAIAKKALTLANKYTKLTADAASRAARLTP